MIARHAHECNAWRRAAVPPWRNTLRYRALRKTDQQKPGPFCRADAAQPDGLTV